MSRRDASGRLIGGRDRGRPGGTRRTGGTRSTGGRAARRSRRLAGLAGHSRGRRHLAIRRGQLWFGLFLLSCGDLGDVGPGRSGRCYVTGHMRSLRPPKYLFYRWTIHDVPDAVGHTASSDRTSRPDSLARPSRKPSSSRTAIAATSAPARRTRLAVAAAVPPVASTSSTTSTRSPGLNASVCTSIVAVPYSSWYDSEYVAAGSLPCLRTGTNPAPRLH